MDDITLAGPLSIAVDALRTLIANVPYFQMWTGTNSTTALKHIFTGEVGYPIASVEVAGGLLSVKTREPHNIEVGDVVTIEGAALGAESEVDLDSTYIVLTITSTSFTAVSSTADIEEMFPAHAFIVPCALPIAIVGDDLIPLRADVIGTGGASVFGGSIDILLEADISAEYANDSRNAIYEARNAFGQFVQGLATTQGTAELMCLNKVEPVMGPKLISHIEQKSNIIRFERWRALLRVEWGIQG
jgi:hypothetical protein